MDEPIYSNEPSPEPYEDRDEEIVATVLAAANLGTMPGFENGAAGWLQIEAARRDAIHWKPQARMILDALTGEGWQRPERQPGDERAQWMHGGGSQ